MIDPNRPFAQARLKHIWATKHINQFQAFWEGFLKSDFYEITVQEDPQRGHSVHIFSTQPLPAELLLTVGDAIHNLRCALDYVVNELTGWKNNRLTFPMGEEREELVSSFRTKTETVAGAVKKKGRNAAIELAIPGIGEFIVNEIRPYKAAGGFLWPLHRLDGRDKHSLLIVLYALQTIRNFSVIDNDGKTLIGGGTFVLQAGRSLNLGRIGNNGMKIGNKGQASAEIFFNEVGVIERQPVLPTLVNMSNAVAETIDRIEKFLADIGREIARDPRAR